MDYSADFFEPYINQVKDDVACSKLIGLRHEYEKQLSNLIREERIQTQYHKIQGKKISQTFEHHRKNLANEYKQKAMETAQPHMDAATLEKIAKEHASEQDRDNSITQSQSRMLEKIEEHRVKEASKQNAPTAEPDLPQQSQEEAPPISESEPEARPEKSARELAYEKALEEIKKQQEQNKEMTKERER